VTNAAAAWSSSVPSHGNPLFIRYSIGGWQMWHTIRNADGSWTPQFGSVESQESNNPGPFSAVGCGGVGAALQVAGVGSDDQLWHTIRNADGSWTPQFGLIESQESNNPGPFSAVACAGVGDALQVVGLGGDGQLWHTIRNADGSWTPQFGSIESQEQNNPGPFSAVTCGGVGASLQVVGVGSDGELWCTTRNQDGSWTPQFVLIQAQNNPAPFTAVACAGVGYALQVVGLGSDGQLWHIIHNADGTWSPQFGLIESQERNNPGLFGAVACGGVGDALQVVGATLDGQLWHTIRNADGTWAPQFGSIQSQEQNNPGPFRAVSCAGVGDALQLVGLA
jgi:hypothetical protein